MDIKNGDDLLVILSFDGAEAFRSNKKITSVISFSSSLFTPAMVSRKQIIPGSSVNILTWMQILGKEQIDVLEICSSKYFEERQSLIDGRAKLVGLEQSKLYHYDAFDGKLLYEHLQCSKWNRTSKRFCICSCSQHQGVENDEHQCQIFTDTPDYEMLFLKARRR
jgi:hypothetical protein